MCSDEPERIARVKTPRVKQKIHPIADRIGVRNNWTTHDRCNPASVLYSCRYSNNRISHYKIRAWNRPRRGKRDVHKCIHLWDIFKCLIWGVRIAKKCGLEVVSLTDWIRNVQTEKKKFPHCWLDKYAKTRMVLNSSTSLRSLLRMNRYGDLAVRRSLNNVRKLGFKMQMRLRFPNTSDLQKFAAGETSPHVFHGCHLNISL